LHIIILKALIWKYYCSIDEVHSSIEGIIQVVEK